MTFLRKLIHRTLLALAFSASMIGPVYAQPVDEKKADPGTTSPAIPYGLAAIGTIIVMVLICMPARRE